MRQLPGPAHLEVVLNLRLTGLLRNYAGGALQGVFGRPDALGEADGFGTNLDRPAGRPYSNAKSALYARSSAGQSGGFLNRRSEVRVLPGAVCMDGGAPRAGAGG